VQERRKTGSRLPESGVHHQPVPRFTSTRTSRASRCMNDYNGVMMTDLSYAREGGTKGG
jgi:hypothetical protein